MRRLRAWLVRILQGEAKSSPPSDEDGQLRTDHPKRTVDGSMGPYTRVAAAHYVARPGMPEGPGLHWEVHYVGGGAFAVELRETWAPVGRGRIGQRLAPMADLSPATIVAMARDIMHWRTKF